MMLNDSNRDNLSEAMWGLFGIAGGSAIPAIRNIFFDGVQGLNFLETLFFFVPLAAAIVILIISKKRSKKSNNLLSEIKSRQKVHSSTISTTTKAIS